VDKEDDFREEREQLLREVEAEYRDTAAWTGRSRMNPRVRAAIAKVPRHAFVLEGERSLAYVNAALPIGHGQTISQPYIVAIMTDLLDLEPDDVVLEVGTGSGYQAAVLAELAEKVYSVEFVQELSDRARETLAALGYDNVEMRVGDGRQGWPERAPFDAIIVTAATPEIPPPLVEQLKPGGRMVVPVGEPFFSQDLMRVEKDADGKIAERSLLPVAFVPLVRREHSEP
jgi:protein-L-isoaspartate(D-aspartate) O-methyltransferase